MSLLSRLLRVGSLAQSMGVYLPAMLVQKGMGLVRLVILTYLLSKRQMGLWGLGMMVFTLGSPLVTLGSSHGLVRYVSHFEARGRLWSFFLRTLRWVLVLSVVLSAMAWVGSRPLFHLLTKLRYSLTGAESSAEAMQYQWQFALAVLGNVCVMALYLNLLGFMHGLRAYRLASAVEVFFTTVFTAVGIGWVFYDATATSLLMGHLVSLALSVVCGGVLLTIGVRRIATARPETEPQETDAKASLPMSEPVVEGDEVAMEFSPQPAITDQATGDERPFLRVVRFGLVSMVGTFLFLGAQYVAYLMTYLRLGGKAAGPLLVFMQLAQPVTFLASAAWSVLFAHVARRWESRDRRGAMYVLETAYRAIVLAVMTCTVLLYVSSPLWIRILDQKYQYGHYYLSGLLTFFVTVSNLTLLTALAKLHERPIIIALAALAGSAFIAMLAELWMPPWHVVGAARAAGVGMFFGSMLVTLVYLQASGTRLQDSTYFVLGTPILLLLPAWILGILWALVLPVCLWTHWLFTARQKQILWAAVRKGFSTFGRLRR